MAGNLSSTMLIIQQVAEVISWISKFINWLMVFFSSQPRQQTARCWDAWDGSPLTAPRFLVFIICLLVIWNFFVLVHVIYNILRMVFGLYYEMFLPACVFTAIFMAPGPLCVFFMFYIALTLLVRSLIFLLSHPAPPNRYGLRQ